MKKWKFVFGFALFLYLIDLLSIPFRNEISPKDFVGLIVFGITLIPMYGFAYNVAIGSKRIAIAIFIFNALWIPYGLYFTVIMFIAYPGVFQAIFSCLGLFFLWVFIYPSFMYSFKSNELWNNKATSLHRITSSS